MDKITLLLDECGDDIYTFCIYLCKNKTDGEDLFQDTFVRAAEISFKINMHYNPKSYLISIAINLWKNVVKKRTRRYQIAPIMQINHNEENLLMDHQANVEESVVKKMLNETLLNAINKLDDKYRIPLILFYSEDMKISEISSLIKKPEGTVKRLLHEAKKKSKKNWRIWDMKDNCLDQMIKKSFSNKFTVSENLKLQTKRKIYHENEKRNCVILCAIQVALSLLSIAFVIIICTFNPMLLSFVLVYFAMGSLINISVVLLNVKNTNKKGRVEFYE